MSKDYALTITVYGCADSDEEAEELGWRLAELLRREPQVDEARLDAID